MKIYKQRDDYSCTPLAILNALNGLGCSYKYKDLAKFKALCGTVPGYGTDDNKVFSILTKLGYVCQAKHRPTLDFIDKKLDQGKVVLLTFAYKEDGEVFRHTVSIHSRTPCFYYVSNYGWKFKFRKVSRANLKKDLKAKWE
jgi:hypothetical protein